MNEVKEFVEKGDSSFQEILTTDKLVVFDFYAVWCNPCKVLSGIMDNIAKDYPNVNFYKSDVEQNVNLTDKMGIRNVPTVIFFKDGKRLDTVSGLLPDKTYINIIKNYA